MAKDLKEKRLVKSPRYLVCRHLLNCTFICIKCLSFAFFYSFSSYVLNVTVILSRDLSRYPLHHQAQNNINRDCFHTSVTVTQVQQKAQVIGGVICVGDCNILENVSE